MQKSTQSILFCGKSDKEAYGLLDRSKYNISAETLEELRWVAFLWEKILKIFGVSRWLICLRVTEFGSENISGFSTISDQELYTLIPVFFERHNGTTCQTLLIGYIGSLGIRVHKS